MKNLLVRLLFIFLLLILILSAIDYMNTEKEFLIIYDAYATNYPPYTGYESSNGLDTIYGIKRHYMVYNYDASTNKTKLNSLIDKIICQEISNLPGPIGFYEFTFEKMRLNASKYKTDELISTSLKWGEVNLITKRSKYKNEGKPIIDKPCSSKSTLIPICPECKNSVQIFPPVKNIEAASIDFSKIPIIPMNSQNNPYRIGERDSLN